MQIEFSKEGAKELKRLLYISALAEANKMNSTGLSNILYFIGKIEEAEKAEAPAESVETAEVVAAE